MQHQFVIDDDDNDEYKFKEHQCMADMECEDIYAKLNGTVYFPHYIITFFIFVVLDTAHILVVQHRFY